MSEQDYLDGILGDDKLEPEELGTVRRYVGDKPKVEVIYGSSNRRDGYPFLETDYNPRIDEDWSEHEGL